MLYYHVEDDSRFIGAFETQEAAKLFIENYSPGVNDLQWVQKHESLVIGYWDNGQRQFRIYTRALITLEMAKVSAHDTGPTRCIDGPR